MVYGGKQLDKIIKTDAFNSIVFSALKETDVYVVGGYIRDTLLGKTPLDRDYVIKGQFAGLLGKVAIETGGKLVRIGKGELYRIVLKNGMSLDFSPARDDIAADLEGRDFTINSMAWSPSAGLIDLHQGVRDLSDKIIRIVHGKSIQEDPVRILRAFRFASELDFDISQETGQALRRFRHMLGEAKTERITLEFFKILSLEDAVKPLSLMLDESVLPEIISCSNEDLANKINVIYQVKQKLNNLPLTYRFKLMDIVTQNLSQQGLYCLEILLSGLPDNLLSLSSKIRRRLHDIDKARRIMNGVDDARRDNLFEAFEAAGLSALDYLITEDLTGFIDDLERYQEVSKKPLLAAEDIRGMTGIGGGILMGRIIKALKKAHFLGQVRSRRGAVMFVKKFIRALNLT